MSTAESNPSGYDELVGSTQVPQRDFDLAVPISKPAAFGMGNLSVVEIDPNGREASLRWEAFNKRNGDAFNVPFEVITVSAGCELYAITDQFVGNNALKVNGTVHKFDSSQRLRVRFGHGVSIVGGFRSQPFPGQWADTMKFYQCTYSALNRVYAGSGAPGFKKPTRNIFSRIWGWLDR